MAEIVTSQVVPAAVAYQNQLLASVEGLHKVLPKDGAVKAQAELLKTVASLISEALEGVSSLRKAMEHAEGVAEEREKALAYCHKVKPHFDKIRAAVDALEALVPDRSWPMPKYREMLFIL